MYFTPIGPWNTPTPGGVTSAAQKIPLATAPVMTEEETYAEYLWRERTESGGEVDKTTSDIRASATSDVLPTDECKHVPYWTIYLVEEIRDKGRITNVRQNYEQGTECVYCPMCGEKL